MSHNGTESQRTSPKADIITFRRGDKMVYVPLSRSYEETIKNARKVFSDLANIKSDHIILSLGVHMKETRAKVHISPMAWPSVAATLHRYEVLNVEVEEDKQDSNESFSHEKVDFKFIVQDMDAPLEPPSYLTVPEVSPPESMRRSRSYEQCRSSSPDGKASTHSEKTEKISWLKRLCH